MKKYVLALILLVTGLNSFGQKAHLSGKLVNVKSKALTLMSFTGYFKDSIPLNADGTFNYETNQIKCPFDGTLTNGNDISFVLFIAPGYDLKINADVSDPRTLSRTTKYNGVGAKSNAYHQDYMKTLRLDTVKWYTKDVDTYIRHLLEEQKTLTDLIKKHFNSSNQEPYSKYFKQSLLKDLKYSSINDLLDGYADENHLNWQQITAIFSRLGLRSLEQELNQDSNLSGFSFSFLVRSYPNYCYKYNAFPADEEIKKQGNYQLYLASRFYTGKVYDFIMFEEIPDALNNIFKVDGFEKLKSYADKISDPKLKELTKNQISAHIKERMAIKPGMVSPLFNLPDTSGTMHELCTFKGKVVYIDLWASWCGPCKQETPFLKNIVERYKNDSRIKIISIACWDANNRKSRYEIIKKDQMDWMQLEDTQDDFAKSYQVASIPRFIIIDKNGNILDNDAPRPSNAEKLISILEQEIAK